MVFDAAFPERSASRGLNWSSSLDLPRIAENTRDLSRWVAEKYVTASSLDEQAWWARKAARVHTRLLVCDAGMARSDMRAGISHDLRTKQIILAIEKMADCLEDSVSDLDGAGGATGRSDSWMLLAKGFAEQATELGAYVEMKDGPFAGLSLIAKFVATKAVKLESKDAVSLVRLVNKARQIPPGFRVDDYENRACANFIWTYLGVLKDRGFYGAGGGSVG